MEHIKYKLPDKINDFFNRLSKYIDKKLYYYGSIQRLDYFPGSSDIDVDIFTDNMHSTIMKLKHFLNTNDNIKFKKIYWKLAVNNKMVYGYKLMYENTKLNLKVEFSLYDEKYKDGVLQEHNRKIILPFYVSFLLIVLKKLYYDFKLINENTYGYIKKKILLTRMIGYPEDKFVAV